MAPLTNFNDEGKGGAGAVGGGERGIFYTQRNHNIIICLPIKITNLF